MPTATSYPVHARLTIQKDAWIATIPDLPTPARQVASTPATFQDYLLTLAEWETELFSELTMLVDCYEVIWLVKTTPLCNTAIHLLMTSDGSDNAGAMTFGWILSLSNGQRLARCSGPAYGPFGSAKGYGFLLVSRFLLRLHEYCGVTPSWHVKMMTDNLGLITWLKKSLLHLEPFPNITLLSDWDVTNEIVCTLHTMTIQPTLEHVKGHQDDHIQYSNLPLDAQLNVDADEEAGFYQEIYPQYWPVIPRLPHNRAQLHISGKVISSKIKQSVRNAYTVPPYMEYLKARNQWTSQCLHSIDWDAYNQTISRFPS
jgi:hypothetical protein